MNENGKSGFMFFGVDIRSIRDAIRDLETVSDAYTVNDADRNTQWAVIHSIEDSPHFVDVYEEVYQEYEETYAERIDEYACDPNLAYDDIDEVSAAFIREYESACYAGNDRPPISFDHAPQSAIDAAIGVACDASYKAAYDAAYDALSEDEKHALDAAKETLEKIDYDKSELDTAVSNLSRVCGRLLLRETLDFSAYKKNMKPVAVETIRQKRNRLLWEGHQNTNESLPNIGKQVRDQVEPEREHPYSEGTVIFGAKAHHAEFHPGEPFKDRPKGRKKGH